MRDILFRGKTIKGEWVEGSLLQADPKKIVLPEMRFYYEYEKGKHCLISKQVIPETIGQYTGLTDKNGKKIFEGDIVKLFLIDDVEIGVIAYDEENLRLMFHDGHSHYGYDNTCQFEVIGNIYDNIELLM